MNSSDILEILNKDELAKEDLLLLLSCYDKDERELIFEKSKAKKKHHVGDKIYLRGLIEYSNVCAKNCLYCGIRAHNHQIQRYTLTVEDVLQSAQYAYENRYASLVIQSGEVSNPHFVDTITDLLNKIHRLTNHQLRVTLSCGEQSLETYQKWHDAGAHRYLLRIESSDKSLFKSIHPQNKTHDFDIRLKALHDLKKAGYQVGSGIMIGLPGQTLEHLVNDLWFLKEFDIDMVGMGPYVEHIDTPIFERRHELISQQKRYQLSLTMMALLRILMKDINIASTTALDAIHPTGRIEALNIASNVLMPNLTPVKYLENYHLYNNKPDTFHADSLVQHIEKNATIHGSRIALGEQGDSAHYWRRKT